MIGTSTFEGEPWCYRNQFSSSVNVVSYSLPSLFDSLQTQPSLGVAVEELQFHSGNVCRASVTYRPKTKSQRCREALEMACLHSIHQLLRQKIFCLLFDVITSNLRLGVDKVWPEGQVWPFTSLFQEHFFF